MNNLGLGLAGSVLLLLFNAFFVGASFALVSARRSKIEPLAATSRRARRTLQAMDRLPQLMAGAQLGITICSVGLGALAEPAIAHALEGPMDSLGVPHGWVHPAAFSVALLLVVLAHVLVGEMVPKNFTLAVPDRAVLLLAPALATFATLLGPVLTAIRMVAVGVLKLMRIQPPSSLEHVFGVPEVAAIAAESHREGLLDDEEYRLMERALDFTATRARDVAIPPERLHTLPLDASNEQIEALAVRTRHMRFPVVDASGHAVGYVHLKDLLHGDTSVPGAPLRGPVIRDLPAIPPETPLPDTLALLREARAPMAVLGTKARPVGVVTLDDVIVALVQAGSAPPPSAASATP
ncbi:MAG: CNNM domain-containing protein [Sporichthyaceae bacterium]